MYTAALGEVHSCREAVGGAGVEICSMKSTKAEVLSCTNEFIGSIHPSFWPNAAKLASPCSVLAMRVRLRCDLTSGGAAMRPKSLGLRTAGTKKRRKMKAETDVQRVFFCSSPYRSQTTC